VMRRIKILIPEVIPPETIVKLVKADGKTAEWKKEVGTVFRVGYYSKQDGLDTIWLVDASGSYCQATSRDFLLQYFEIIKLSQYNDPYGENSPQLGPML
jgi:hypothetical protein